jgi:hypothetical protein
VVHNQSVAVLHQHMPHVAQLRFSALAPFGQACIGIRRGGVRFVASLSVPDSLRLGCAPPRHRRVSTDLHLWVGSSSERPTRQLASHHQ